LKSFLFFVLLDDLEVSPDFLDYFQALYPLLKYDKTIWCISAWNDNGINGKIDRQPSERRKLKLNTHQQFF
jgi:alpha-1,3-mannosyl-glycoprotein beta-1,2-N-acetylglucosaminyltransferase